MKLREYLNERETPLTRKQIIDRLKFDKKAGMMGWIGEFTGNRTDNNNLGGIITFNMVQKLENEGIIEYIGDENIWVMRKEYEKALRDNKG